MVACVAMKVFFRLSVNFLCISFVFVVDGGEFWRFSFSLFFHDEKWYFSKSQFAGNSKAAPVIKAKSYSSRYINDFNATSPFEPIYDYDNTKTEIDKIPLQQESTKSDDNMEIIYPDPEDFHRKMMNKSRMENHHEDTVIKICELNVLLMNI